MSGLGHRHCRRQLWGAGARGRRLTTIHIFCFTLEPYKLRQQSLRSNIFTILHTTVIKIKFIIFFILLKNAIRGVGFLKHSVFVCSSHLCVSLEYVPCRLCPSSRLILATPLSQSCPRVGSGWVEIFQFLVRWVGSTITQKY